MRPLSEARDPNKLPQGVTLEKPPFVPRMVMTDELKIVTADVMNQWRGRKVFAPLLKYGIRPLDRLLFHGPPGNGKTMACYWIAKELGIPLYRVLCDQLRAPHLGETARNIADVMTFFDARTEPALCLWDEVESIFVDRKDGGGPVGRQEYGGALTVFMQYLDRWKSPTLLVMATNLPDHLDAALLSRIELKLEFSGPSEDQCRQLIEYWRELLHDHGAEVWGPLLEERIAARRPASFRELQQAIAYAARDWTARQCR
ncbi:MAG TPA: ATP-binding protein [Gemmataceae bacterium]|nr:ATP-binding protein [Gemmataceae bacterium]